MLTIADRIAALDETSIMAMIRANVAANNGDRTEARRWVRIARQIDMQIHRLSVGEAL